MFLGDEIENLRRMRLHARWEEGISTFAQEFSPARQRNPISKHEKNVELIAATTTGAGLTVRANSIPTPIRSASKPRTPTGKRSISKRHDFHGDWNYIIEPNQPVSM
ncbi:hypothetical protein FHP25_01295 [Vineibacter terrae]|uniref:Uncharacterized protein n=1 Tax=Vineibacter terrae TaxID=2586908 RepID=A0A5C8PWV9_9HYPH|nr:hypothetical protein FHP25_01295 [Vineibacter terrae]